jgi:hypothetical protein
MRQIGLLFIVFGVGSAVLHLMDMEFKLLRWIENWGPNVAWGIRGGMAVVGALLFMVGKPKPKP